MKSDVLIIGGGMAAAWAAIAAAEAGAGVIVVDKGYLGTSGVTATGGPNHWWVGPDKAQREEAIARQSAKSLGLGDPEWMARILDITFRHLPDLAPYYPFGSDGRGGTYFSGVRGPEYMRALRLFTLARGVTILDHHPALELTADSDGRITGARGHALRLDEPWEITAGATILATGGNAFRSGLLGSHLNTGDGFLMAAEAGAKLSGLEFGPSWSHSPTWASTRTLPYTGARYYDEAGRELDLPPIRQSHAHHQALAAALLQGPVLADLCDAPSELPPILRRIQPFTPAPFERRGIDLFKDRWPIRLWGEGTIRGVGGIDIVDADCRTGVAGLFAVGDAATRELVAGANSGGGAVNSAWALSSGRIAGAAAAAEARLHLGLAPSHGLGRYGLHPSGEVRDFDLRAINAATGDHVHGYERALWRDEATLHDSEEQLSRCWRDLSSHAHARGRELVALRETFAMLATARWSAAAARHRRESRGLHQREDYRAAVSQGPTRLLTSGFDAVQVEATRPELEPA